MILAIFGGTGRAGRYLLEQALAAGHDLTALVRDPARVDLKHERLTLVTGDARQSEAVAATIAGAEAVISVLGPRDNGPERAVTQATKNILDAMRAQGVRRLVDSAGAGVGDPRDRPGLLHHVISALLKLTARNVYEDMVHMVALVRGSDVDWTIVRVPMLVDGAATGRVRVGSVGVGTGPRLTRADLAAFLLETVEKGAHVREAPVISGP
jgi:putative NADH-flavin reductase